MRDFEAERPVVRGTRVYGNTTKCGPLKPYNLLLETIDKAAEKLADKDGDALRRLAWFLGMEGETHACEVIMKHADISPPELIWTPWGRMTEKQWKQMGGASP